MGLFGRGIIGNNNGNEIKASGGVITIDGDYKIHTFDSGIANFSVQYIPNGTTDISASVLVVGGGGCGGDIGLEPGGLNGYGGGGGAGGVVYLPYGSASLNIGLYSITVGDGGAGGIAAFNNGDDSLISGSTFNLIAKGGGFGGSAAYTSGSDGGSGGGGAGIGPASSNFDYRVGGSEIQSLQAGDSSTYGYGNNGGTAVGTYFQAASGGGAAGAGAPGSPGGVGILVAEFGGIEYYVGGGGSAGGNGSEPAKGGGGSGGSGKDGTDGLGGGGGGGDRNGTGSAGGSGGRGVVKIRYKYKNL